MSTRRSTSDHVYSLGSTESFSRRRSLHPSIAAYQRSMGIRQMLLNWLKDGDAWALAVCIIAIVVVAAEGCL